ncbi:MAG: GIY-YIG nuclease family protein [Parvibaculum sp.]|nr:GIY-YIG nuclease family protein [Parvibaculum sp.]
MDGKTGSSAPMGWHLYILECAGGRLYTGIARDVEARFRAHAAGKGAKFTRSYRPERIVFIRPFESRADALREEHAVKKLSAAAKRELIRAGYR